MKKIIPLTAGSKLVVTPSRIQKAEKPHVFLFVNGFFSDHGIWDRWVAEVAKQCGTCYALEFPGRIADGLNIPDIGMKDYAGAVAEAIAAIKNTSDSRLTVISHSAGCLATCMALSGEVGEAVDEVVHLNPAPMKEIFLSWQVRLRSLKYLMSILAGDSFKLTDEDVREILLSGYRTEANCPLPESREESGRAVRDLLFGVRVENQPSCMTVVVGCHQDRMTPLYISQRTFDLLSQKTRGGEAHITYLDFRGCGHLPMVGQGAIGRLTRILEVLGC
jgi:pimeloyl-ACP methyl ester carboxylesterase